MPTTTIPERDRPVHDLAEGVARALAEAEPGRGWQYVAPGIPGGYDWTHSAHLCSDDGETLYLYPLGYRGRGPGRVGIRGEYPRTAAGRAIDACYLRDTPDPEATVRVDRGPDAIAREIIRRVLPGYRARLARVLALLDDRATRRTQRDELAAQVLEWSDGTTYYDPRTRENVDPDDAIIVSAGGDRDRIEVSAEHIRIERLTFNLTTPEGRARAERVCRALAE